MPHRAKGEGEMDHWQTRSCLWLRMRMPSVVQCPMQAALLCCCRVGRWRG